jgi:hypothetical protein
MIPSEPILNMIGRMTWPEPRIFSTRMVRM